MRYFIGLEKIVLETPMNKLLAILVLSTLCIGYAYTQFDAQFSQYMFNHSAFNPASAGQSGLIDITGHHRIQWVGMPNAGQTTVFGITSPLKVGKSTNGIGFRFLNDNVGQFTNQSAHLQYAYKKQTDIGTFSFGTEVGFLSIGYLRDSLKIPSSEYHESTDPVIPTSNVVGMSFDMSIGVWYSNNGTYAGISYTHLNQPKVDWNNNYGFQQNGIVYLTGGTRYTFPDYAKYVIKPSFLFKSDFNTFQLDLSTLLEYDNKYWGGLAYRFQDAVVIIAGMNISGGLSLGYSYDLPASKMITASSGSHEVLLSYSFEYVFGKKNTKYKSIRIL